MSPVWWTTMAAVTSTVALAIAAAPAKPARVAGRVVNAASQPVRGALVLIAGTDVAVSRVTATDDAGRFSFVAVPAGHVLVVAGKPTYLAALYGAAHAGRPGKTVAVGTDPSADLVITIARGATVSGHVMDDDGQPVAGARVRVTSRRLVGKVAVLGGDIGDPSAVLTDEAGAFRVFDIPPGDYVVGVAARGLAAGDTRVGDASPDEPAPSPQGASVGYAPAYFPAAASPEGATVVTLAAGTDRTGLEIKTKMVRMARIDGAVAGVEGTMPPNQIQIRPRGWMTAGALLYSQTTRVGGDGRFAFTNVPPGEYTIYARTLPSPRDPILGDTRPRPTIWAMSDVTVAQADAHVIMHWDGGLTVSGHVTFAGMAHAPDDVTVRIGLRPTAAMAGVAVPDAVPVSADGRFTLKGVLPGEYWLTVQVPASPRTQLPDWIAGSAIIDGHDAFDEAFAVGPNLGAPDIPVVLTQETQQIDGTLRDGRGHAVTDCPVVIFSADRRFWFPQSRHIAMRRTDTTGGLLFNLGAALPPGEYYVAAAPDLGPNEQYDPSLLGDLTATARKVTMATGSSETVQLRLAKKN
jgi:hypothetical protein